MTIDEIILRQHRFMCKLSPSPFHVLFLGRNIMTDLLYDSNGISIWGVLYYRGIQVIIDDSNDETISVRIKKKKLGKPDWGIE